jgi:hypothetical protein
LWANPRGAYSGSAEEGHRAGNWIRYRGARHLLCEGVTRARLAAERSRLGLARQHQGVECLDNVRAPVAIDVRGGMWGVEDDAPFDAMISLNMVHIAPWEAALGLLAGAGRLLRPDGVLFFYGPFMLGGTHRAASNAVFDADLKRRDPRWGVRDVDDLVGEAATHGLELHEVVEMPVNNLFARLCQSGAGRPSLISHQQCGN